MAHNTLKLWNDVVGERSVGARAEIQEKLETLNQAQFSIESVALGSIEGTVELGCVVTLEHYPASI